MSRTPSIRGRFGRRRAGDDLVEGGTARSVDDVLDLLEAWGSHHYDEVVTQLDHALQTAALARRDGAADSLVVAALCHDVGHLLALRAGHGAPDDSVDETDLRHEAAGSRWLRGVFPVSVTGPIGLHVAAKRYRCAVVPGALEALSPASVASLARQGGLMRPDEAARFELNPSAGDAVALRAWDDAGKVEDLEVPGLASYEALLRRVAGER